MQINVIYDPSVASAPSGFKTAVAYVDNLLDTAFTNDITLNIPVPETSHSSGFHLA